MHHYGLTPFLRKFILQRAVHVMTLKADYLKEVPVIAQGPKQGESMRAVANQEITPYADITGIKETNNRYYHALE